ncbi:NAD(P)-dependent dehydrogenase, short-chain alcohol dehydrogenase family [Draconibacterium orientale]|uniref:NAD(P)-dependent dehydrogenase, short-chain alcohol dehydrogenase family n=1 Tax=Draconibacterium orientale TaxID=1168034 RepID=X5DGR0_9BACT|nr:SDR family NAD(P)-dependent oxidoreductase [Draconibacterium orientale]AHW59642.1 short-chain dehydrogenase [Draconibacterium orientale]SES81225.1 NAD(P)-dependent dehydrogenase, short-chain alcohol dehydrogenase family [Draconibacterium orientale]
MIRTALITGASKRIGRALTEHLAEKGWNVVVHYNSSSKGANALVEELEKKYPDQEFRAVQANLAETDEVAALIPKLAAGKINVDLLINNASVFNRGYLKDTSVDLFDSQLDVNLKAPFFLTRDFANYFQTGNIINFVDTRITANASNFAAYSIAKKALWELTKMAALEFAPDIRVNAIAPGVTLPPEDEDEDYLENLAQGIPMKKPGGVEPILKSLDYILENNHLTGQLLFADGGENLGKNR